ncbi:hypothetical protein [Salmonella phage PS3-1]|nr:hypothetical protein [Salmonella phage PS3-1]
MISYSYYFSLIYMYIIYYEIVSWLMRFSVINSLLIVYAVQSTSMIIILATISLLFFRYALVNRSQLIYFIK